MSGIRAAVFDLGGVLLGYDFSRWAAKTAPYCRPGVDLLGMVREYHAEHAALTGNIDMAEIQAWLANRAGLQGMSAEDFELAWCDIFWRMPEMEALVSRLPIDGRYLLSNTNWAHVDWIEQRYPDVLALFDRVFLSCELRMAKPDPIIYDYVQQRTCAAGFETIFVDDRLDNVAAARAAGWHGIHFQGIEPLRAELAKYLPLM